MKKIFTGFLLLLIYSQGNAQQVYSNEEWINYSGSPDSINWTASKVTGSGDLVVVSNSKNLAGNTDVLISKFSSLGALIWQQTFDGPSNGNDYGIKVVLGPSSEIYVIASIGVDDFNTDIGVLKYSSSGVLQWSDIWDGDALHDLASDLILDSTGDLYVVGSTSNATYIYTDFITLKYNSSGVLQWESFYDYANLADGALFVDFKSSNLLVGGLSNSTSTSSDAANLEIDKSTGSIISTTRTAIPGLTMVFPKAITTDDDMNIYITGFADNSGDIDIQTFKMDQDLNLLWIESYDGGDYDNPTAISVDDNGNVIVVGSQQRASGASECLTIKYDDSGTLLWTQVYRADGATTLSNGTDVCTAPNGDIFVTGTVFESTGNYFNTIYYDTDGNIKHVMKHKDVPGIYSNPRILLSGNDIFVTGIKESPVSAMTALKYTFDTRVEGVELVGGEPSHISNEVIISFNSEMINTDYIDKRGTTFGPLSNFIDSTLVDSLNTWYPAVDWGNTMAYKIFLGMTTADNTSISRGGHQVDVFPFWTSLIVNVDKEDAIDVVNALNTASDDYIWGISTNSLASLTTGADDALYSSQHALMSTTYPDGHINIEDAWDIETGKSAIRVGVYDTGIKYDHEDMGGFYACQACKVQGGYDYLTNSSLANIPNSGDQINGSSNNGHGTKMAGIIGALRNNEIDIAGIAGGNWPYENTTENVQVDPLNYDIENTGVSMLGFRIFNSSNMATFSNICNALVEGALNTTNGYGYGIDIMNNSWKMTVGQPYNENAILYNSCQRNIFKNQVIHVASRGNDIQDQAFFPENAIREWWVLNVGGSGNNGLLHPNSGYAGDMDFIAPASSNLVMTTSNTSTSATTSADGTSSAAAITSGLAGLMLSHLNYRPEAPNGLTPDDVEFLIQKYATDKTIGTGYSVGYDNNSGWGLLNAGNVMEHIDRTEYIVKHYELETPLSITGLTPQNGTSYIGAYPGIPNGNYNYKVYTLTYNISNNLNSGDVILDYWPLNSYTTLLSTTQSPVLNSESECSVTGMTSSTGTIQATAINVTYNNTTNSAVNYWIPAAPGQNVRAGYTLHIQSSFASLDENSENTNRLSCYPNPSKDNVNLEFILKDNSSVDAQVTDINGAIVYQAQKNNLTIGQQKMSFPVSNWSNGVYFVKLTAGSEIYYAKFIKN